MEDKPLQIWECTTVDKPHDNHVLRRTRSAELFKIPVNSVEPDDVEPDDVEPDDVEP